MQAKSNWRIFWKRTVCYSDRRFTGSGKSSLEFVSSLRKSGLKVKGLVSIFNYGFELLKKTSQTQNVIIFRYMIMKTYATVLKTNYITKIDLPILQKWRENPSKWNI